MPGRRLNDTERALQERWANPHSLSPRPTLRSITISGGTGLRGLGTDDGLILHFRHPLTAICGTNGAGKSTILALAALAHHSPSGWRVHRDGAQPRQAQGDRTYYTFSDFFVSTPDESVPDGVAVTWRYQDSQSETAVSFTKTGARWGRYTARPEREVCFLPLSRILPAHESVGVRGTFVNAQPQLSFSTPLSAHGVETLSYVMGRAYILAQMDGCKRYTLSRARTQPGTAYSAFNMGGGETAVIALLHVMERLPRGGLLVIEEIEAGLHPQAQVRLALALLEACRRRHFQIICSTHSGAYLDALPREARLLLVRAPGAHLVYERPSTRFALSEMLGQAQHELIVYCEDRTAAILIEEALPAAERRRVVIRDVGSAVTVVRQLVAHLRYDLGAAGIAVLDGDCTEAQATSWVESERAERHDLEPTILRLPGGVPPERWVTQQLSHSAYRDAFASEFGCSLADASALIEAVSVEPQHHRLGQVLYERTNRTPEDCIRRTMRAVAAQHPELDPLRNHVRSCLD